MKHGVVVAVGILAALLVLAGSARSIFTDIAHSENNEISSGKFDIAISKDNSRFYNDLKLFEFSNLKPGDSREVVLYVKNRGDVPVSKLTMTLHVNDYEDGPLSPSEAAVDSTPDRGELSGNLIITSITVEAGGKTTSVENITGKSLAELNGNLITLALDEKIAPGNTAKITLKIAFSENAGNECQTDRTSVDIELTAEQ
ncbi:methyltransferase [Thermococcus sp. M36]|uniref:M1 family metallopeptidase n=1 Tax=Thermococcus sp. M36 TaxID=1638261 RepID=UPI001439F491|nr:M1 family metallopeptidase [Thermococcus sp. M36]NJE05676.1 methyltransferase [Thermococcus sp. M36]